jgi:phage gp37-like protein
VSGLVTKGLGGLSRPAFSGFSFEAIEDAIVSELESALPYLRKVETYAGQVEDLTGLFVIPSPSVFVVYAGTEPLHVDNLTVEEDTTFTLLVVTKNLRGEEEARKGDGAKRGAYEVMEDVKAVLVNNTLGMDVEALRWLRTNLVLSGEQATVYAMDFYTSFDTNYT